jgi:hypothetical protein
MFVAVGRSDNRPTWNNLPMRFRVTLTDDINDTETFFYGEDGPDELFPLDRQSI